jgi:trigger factor
VTVTREVERLENSAVKLVLKISKEDLRSEYDKIIGDYTKTIQIPGFRKGKVPRDILLRKFADAFKSETLAHVIEYAVSETFEGDALAKEDRPLPYSRPEIKDSPTELDLEKDLELSMTYDVFPQFTIDKWRGFEVEAPDVSIEDEDVDRELEVIRERNAIVLDREDAAPSVKGDVVTVNYAELSEAGEPVSGTERQDFVFTLGSANNVFHFDDEITGMKKGETRDITKVYPADFTNSALAGQSKKIRVTVTAVKEKKLPELDDDLAQDVDEKFQTLADLKANIRERLVKKLEQTLRDIKINGILEKILETTPIAIPESMIRVELDARWSALARQLGTTPDNLARSMANSDSGGRETILEGWRDEAVKALRSRLVVEALITEQKLEASDEDVEVELETIASDSNMSVADIKARYASEGTREYLKEGIKEQKLFNLLLAENTVKTGGKKKYLDLAANNQ